ncbi:MULTISPECIES: ecdysteroid 22-kinase family protein [Priestia]|uniref:ecdysteroid 22-kinase family protein n=1 Tax=Priestia TaxID=2800373 RepID=UPI001FB2D819|nr:MULTISPECIES: ecdysteroid 22-kinase family protein [Priestia]MED5247656.1 phosphotransferase [Priestia sp. LL-8]
MYDLKALYYQIKDLKIAEKLSYSMGEKITVIPSEIKCLKSTKRSSIYKLLLQRKNGYYPIIFKVYNSTAYKNEVEITIYKKSYPILKEFLPRIYLVETVKNETWVFMEFVNQIRGQLTFSPSHFQYIIPSIAKLHGQTFENRFKKNENVWRDWLPVYTATKKNRAKSMNQTVDLLHAAMKDDRIGHIIKPYYSSLIKLYNKGPDFFPELTKNGLAITHGDLHMQNICSKNVTGHTPWPIQFIDWESAKYAPVWFDMVVLVELLLGFRKDWQPNAEKIRTQCVGLYVAEMKKHGITFKTNPMILYKMAYLQRTLERGLHTQLRRIADNREGELLSYHLEKISTWGKELGIYQ